MSGVGCNTCGLDVPLLPGRRRCRTCENARVSEWRKSDRGREVKAAWNALNVDKVREMKRNEQQRHKEAYAARARVYGPAWRARNGAKLTVKQRAREQKLHLAGTHSERDWQRTLRRFNNTCAYCPDPATTRDHVVPISRGGSNYIGNIVPACRPCNSSKHNKFLTEWGGRVMAGVS